MTTTDADIIVTPEDVGTGLADSDNADWTSAGHVAALSGHAHSSEYVRGMEMNVNTNGNVEVSPGKAFIPVDEVFVQDQAGAYNNTWSEGVTLAAQTDFVTLPSEANGWNYVYLVLDLTTNNTATWHVESSVTEYQEPSVYIGAFDNTNDVVEQANRYPEGQFQFTTHHRRVALGEVWELESEDQAALVAAPLEGRGEIRGEGQLKVF